MTRPDDKTDREWHLDKKVPIALMVTIALTFGGQAIAFTIWATRLDNRVETLEKRNDDRDRQIEKLSEIAIDIAVLKENVKTTKDDISSMKTGFEMIMQQVLQEKAKR